MNVSTKIFAELINPASHDFILTYLRHLFKVAHERIALAHHSLVNPDQFYLYNSYGEAFLSKTDTSHHYHASTSFGQNGLCSCFQHDSSSQHVWTTTDRNPSSLESLDAITPLHLRGTLKPACHAIRQLSTGHEEIHCLDEDQVSVWFSFFFGKLTPSDGLNEATSLRQFRMF